MAKFSNGISPVAPWLKANLTFLYDLRYLFQLFEFEENLLLLQSPIEVEVPSGIVTYVENSAVDASRDFK